MKNDPIHLEFLLSQTGDGTLTAEQRAAVEAALVAEPRLREVALRYERLAELLLHLRAEQAAPDAPALAARVREALHVALEFQMSQQLDGALSDEDASRLQGVLESTPDLQRARAAMTRTDDLLRRYAADKPKVDFDALASRIRTQVTREALQSRRTGRSWRWIAAGIPIAAAAALALAVLLNRPPARNGGTPEIAVGPETTPTVAVRIAAPPAGDQGRVDVSFDHAIPREFAEAEKAREQREHGQGLVSGRPGPEWSGTARETSQKVLY